jgi:hypothetical protein
MTEEAMAKKAWKFAAGPNLPANAHVNLGAAGVGNRARVKNVVNGQMVDEIDYSGCFELHPGQEIEADVVQHPERLQEAINRGHLVVVTAPEKGK